MKVERIIGEGKEYVYVYYFPSQKKPGPYPCKIGRSKNDPVKRIKKQQASMQEEPVIGLLIKTDNSFRDELYLHTAFSDAKMETYGREWFKITPEGAALHWKNMDFAELTLGQQIRALRIQQGMTQVELAKCAGVRQATISAVENDDQGTRIETVKEIVKELKMRIVLFPVDEEIGERIAFHR